MKKVILLALFVPFPAFGQVSENFESGSLVNWSQSIDGHWKADGLSSLSGAYSLHHVFDNPDAGTDQIGIPLRNLHPSQGITKWSFLIKYGYDPSSLNNWSVFLMSDNGPSDMTAEGRTKGFALGVNLTGSDDSLRLWRIDGSQLSVVVNTRVNWQTDIGATNMAAIAVERSPEGIWTVIVSRSAGSFSRTATGTDNRIFNQQWFGVYYKYSSTRDRLLWFDDIKIEGCFYEDHDPPLITLCKITGRNSVEVGLNEETADSIFKSGNIFLNTPGTNPVTITQSDKITYEIEFQGNFKNKTDNSLIFNKLCDISGNCSENVSVQFTPVWAETGDVVISEIMADPLPELSLPGKEYIEITNRSLFDLSLLKWKLFAGSLSAVLGDVIIKPSEIILLCSHADTILFKKYGKVAGISQFPVLTDGGKLLYLTDSLGELIHGVEYTADWYGDDMKSRGGWSLEMTDTDFPFYSEGNWKASESRKGGTPGSVNSCKNRNPDQSFYGLISVFPSDSSTVLLKFQEPVFSLKWNDAKINDGKEIISSLSPVEPLNREFEIKLNNPIHEGLLYHLKLNEDLHDFAGNTIQKYDKIFGLPVLSEKGDMLFNEILFNPLPGDPDYIEFYNNSGKVLDASRLQILSVNDDTGDKSEPVQLSTEHQCILPHEYFAVTTDRKQILLRYFSSDAEHIFEISSLPSMPDDKGHLILYNRELDLIDELVYSEHMHYSLLAGSEGISLEKINPGSSSAEATSWHSAIETSGWGTPGAPNSVFKEIPENNDRIALSSTKITPDNDGYEDFLAIDLHLKGIGNVITITVFDETGRYVKKLTSNMLAGNTVSIIWDGTSEDGSLVKTGIYIIFITLYDDSGKTEKWKKVCSVIR